MLIVISFPVSAQGSDATVRPDLLNMRYGPGSQYDVVAELTRGTALEIIAIDNIPDAILFVYAAACPMSGRQVAVIISISPGFELNAA
jgi:hypothetical protein